MRYPARVRERDLSILVNTDDWAFVHRPGYEAYGDERMSRENGWDLVGDQTSPTTHTNQLARMIYQIQKLNAYSFASSFAACSETWGLC